MKVIEPRVWALEREIRVLQDQAEAARLALVQAGQMAGQFWTIVNVPAPTTCTATYSGTVLGCPTGGGTAQPVPGATVQIQDGGGTVLDTQTTASDGTYSGSFTTTSTGSTWSGNVVITASGYATDTIPTTFTCGTSNALGTTTLTVGSGACCASFTLQIRHCDGSGNASAGLVCSIGGTTVWAGTADGSGNLAGAFALPSGSSTSVLFTVTPVSGRYNVLTHTYTINCGGNSLGSLTPTAATGYVCTTLCPLPLATTLHITDPVIGIVAMTYSSGLWSGSAVYAYPGCTYTDGTGAMHTCPASTVTVHYGFNSFASISVSFKETSGSFCPTDTGTLTASLFPSGISHTCPTSFSVTYRITVTGLQTAWPLWCLASITFTLTE